MAKRKMNTVKIAHIREKDKAVQPLQEHCRNVGRLCRESGARLGLGNICELIGLLHDLGKATQQFADYLMQENQMMVSEQRIPHQNHSPSGAIFAYVRWFHGSQLAEESIQKLAAQMIALCILGHHSGLADCLDIQGDSPFLHAIEQERKPLHYEEAKAWFLQEVCSAEQLDELFVRSCQELQQFCKQADAFRCGLTARLLLSILVDADRWDSACFAYDADPFAQKAALPDWDENVRQLEQYLDKQFADRSPLQTIRTRISDICAEKAELRPGIYSLSVPTGGGKTLSSLRYALAHAARHGKQRIFYIIPFNTILDQNAQDIREALKNTSAAILEHHSNVVLESEKNQANSEEFYTELQQYKQLTERWDSDIILTSLVQFFNAVFRRENSAARRMYRMTNAVVVFDEIQSLPQKCKALFEQAIQFLADCCGCTILLCTATQPRLQVTKTELMPEAERLYEQLKRVQFIPDIKTQRSYADAAADMKTMLLKGKSVLNIVNTKAAAWGIYSRMQQQLKEAGFVCLALPHGLSKDELRKRAREAAENEILCVHLSTLMCPAHRLECINQIRIWTQQNKLTFCVSTALIEAGINVSFPVVVRSLAGLPSIIQAAGRCNRNMETELGQVYIWRLYEENLQQLPEIEMGQNISEKIIRKKQKNPDFLGTPAAMEQYFRESGRQKDTYPYPQWNTTLNAMLSDNGKCRVEAANRAVNPLPGLCEQSGYQLVQSFRTAGEAFEVIAQNARPVVVPYGAGREIIAALQGRHTMQEEIRLLREAQRYTVNLYDNVYRRLEEEGALCALGQTGAAALREGYYSDAGGVCVQKQELEELIL